MENTVYDPHSGQLVTASLMDYALPRAADVPALAFETRNVPCRDQSAGREGRGRGGRHRFVPGGDERGSSTRCGAPTASATSTCRRRRSGSGPRSPRAGGCIRFDGGTAALAHGIVNGTVPAVVASQRNNKLIAGLISGVRSVPAGAALQSEREQENDPYRACRGSGRGRRERRGGPDRSGLAAQGADEGERLRSPGPSSKMVRGEDPFDAAKVNAAFAQWAETAQKLPACSRAPEARRRDAGVTEDLGDQGRL